MRAGKLLSVYEQKEPEIVDALERKEISTEDARALLNEMLRQALKRVLNEQCADRGLSDCEIDGRIETLKEENRFLRQTMRQRDWTQAQTLLETAGHEISVGVPSPAPSDLGRRATSLKRQINEAEVEALDGEDIRVAAASLLTADERENFDRFVAGEVRMSAAISSAMEHATSRDMERKFSATGSIALEFFGDIPLSTLNSDKVKKLMWFIQQIPAVHGKKHGNNRYVHDRKKASKREEIEWADLEDMGHRAAIESNDLLSLPEKRARLAEVLVARLSMTTVKHHLNRLHSIIRNAEENLGYKGQTRFLTQAKMEAHISKVSGQKSDPLFIRKEKNKEREVWTNERLQKLLLSPVYTGCASKHRRWTSGEVIVRDASYWVPLIVMTLGTRILEVLQLKKTDMVVRNGVLSVMLGITSEHRVKNSDSKRTIPLPQLLLDLGFAEWVHSLPAEQLLLFPEPAEGADIAAISGNFGKRLKTLYRHLDVADWNEDFYALRKTLSSALDDAGVSESRRQAIAGHSGGTMLNRYYTRQNVLTLKSDLEKFDLKLTTSYSEQHGYPIIAGCDLVAKPVAKVEVELSEDETASVVRVISQNTGKVLIRVSVSRKQQKASLSANGTCWTPKKTAIRLREIGETHSLLLPRIPQCRQAIESLLTLAYVSDGAPAAETQ